MKREGIIDGDKNHVAKKKKKRKRENARKRKSEKRYTKRCGRRKAAEDKINLNKKKRKREEKESEIERNPNAIKSLTMARAEKLFASQGHHRESGRRESISGAEAEEEEEEGVRGRKTRRKRSR